MAASGTSPKRSSAWPSRNIEARINRYARLSVSPGIDEAQKIICRERIASLCMKNYKTTTEDPSVGGEVQVNEAFTLSVLNLLNSYDSKKGLFSDYLASTNKYRQKDAKKKSDEEHKRTVSLSSTYGDDGSRTLGETLEDERARKPFDRVIDPEDRQNERANELFVQLLALVTDYLTGNDDKRYIKRHRYTRLFFTETIVKLTKLQPKERDCKAVMNSEQNLFKTMEVPFLDSFMEEVCRTVLRIWRTRIKKGVTGGNAPDVQPLPGSDYYKTWKLSGQMYVGYVRDAYGEQISPQAVSQQRSKYQELIDRMWQNERSAQKARMR